MTTQGQWKRFQDLLFHDEALGFSLDGSRMNEPSGPEKQRVLELVKNALAAMDELERGSIANPDEERMVGHYWLRAPELLRRADLVQAEGGQTAEQVRTRLEREIRETNDQVREFAGRVHRAEITGQLGRPFRHLLLVGIGGSALGPQLLADALGARADALAPHYLDNTDPDGIFRVLNDLQGNLDRTLTIVISKSGGTKETRVGMEETIEAYKREHLDFEKHAVAVTQYSKKSSLYETATKNKWLKTFPMWDWVGGRTSVTSAVGLLPAALQGLDTEGLLAGARAMDELTRRPDPAANPAALLARMWYHAGNGAGTKDMVVLPYKDRLLLLSRYLQQLIMESLGKELDRDGKKVNQGIAVYGNKGSTDQHAYVQQLREGLNNFFATFIEVLRDEAGSLVPKQQAAVDHAYAGDYLEGFYLGTRRALAENGRESLTLTIRQLNAGSLGMLIALFERTVGLYASMVNINAYHQPGVEAGKKAAEVVLIVQLALRMEMNPGVEKTAQEWSDLIANTVNTRVREAKYPELPADERHELVYKILERLSANGRGVERRPGPTPTEATFSKEVDAG